MDIDWKNKIITVYKSDSFMSVVGTDFYEMDTDAFRKALKSREDDEDGIVYSDTHSHNPTYTVAGTTYAETILIVNSYKVEFEDGQYTVKLVGSNNNMFDVGNNVLVRNQVQVIPTNSAGLIVSVQGSGVTDQDKLDIADRVWDELLSEHTIDESSADILKDSLRPSNVPDIVDAIWNELVSQHLTDTTFGGYIQNIKNKTDTIDWTQIEFMWDLAGGKREIKNNQEIFYKADNTTEVARFNLFDKNGVPTETNVYKRERV